tara:strand:- start:5947 stop:7707 length:1761 start_codon:yes stop_codon:yes gene_type:complete
MHLIVEDRVDDVRKKYFDQTSQSILTSDMFDDLVKGSGEIATNHKYLEWMVDRWVKTKLDNPDVPISNKEGIEEVIKAVGNFERVKNRLDQKDIYQYSTLDELFKALVAIDSKQRREVSTREDSEKVYESDRYVVVVPETREASCYYGSGTKWCTAQTDRDYFTNYKKSGELYYIIDKTKPSSDPFYKVALNKKLSGEEDFWDATDKMHISGIGVEAKDNESLMGSIRQHFKGVHGKRAEAAEKEREQREVEREIQQRDRRQAEAQRQRRLNAEAIVRKENNEWEDYDLANALKEYLIDEDEWEGEKKVDIEYDIEQMRDTMENDPEVLEDPSGEKAQEYGEDLGNLEDDLENAESVYDLIPTGYDTDDYAEFEYGGAEYLIATEDGADEYAYERVDNLLDDVGFQGFNPSFVESHIDGNLVAEYVVDMFYEDVNESPEDYLDESNDRELTKEGKDRIDSLKEEIGEYQEQLEDTEDTTEEEELRGLIEELEQTIEEIEEDDDYYEYTEEAKENYVESRIQEVKDDPLNWLRDFGMEEQMDDFMDKDGFIEDVISSDGRGQTISSYDGEEGEVVYNNEYYYIYRMN